VFLNDIEDFDCFLSDFWTDTVAGKNADCLLGHDVGKWEDDGRKIIE
jgi:hypothetical protein